MFRSRPPDGTFNVAKSKNNLPKNRYTDVLCYDHSRVILSEMDNDKDSDYIHANFVDGYKQKNAFINTQGNTNKNIEKKDIGIRTIYSDKLHLKLPTFRGCFFEGKTHSMILGKS